MSSLCDSQFAQLIIPYQLQEMFACNTLKEARDRKNQIIREYQDVAETAMSCLDEGFENAMTAMMLP